MCVDTPSIDPGKNVICEAHQTLLGAQIYGIENMNLERDVLAGKLLTEAIKYRTAPFILLNNIFPSPAILIMQLRCDQPDTVMMVTCAIIIIPSVSIFRVRRAPLSQPSHKRLFPSFVRHILFKISLAQLPSIHLIYTPTFL